MSRADAGPHLPPSAAILGCLLPPGQGKGASVYANVCQAGQEGWLSSCGDRGGVSPSLSPFVKPARSSLCLACSPTQPATLMKPSVTCLPCLLHLPSLSFAFSLSHLFLTLRPCSRRALGPDSSHFLLFFVFLSLCSVVISFRLPFFLDLGARMGTWGRSRG